MSDSWEIFAGALQEESTALQRLHESTLSLTRALVSSSPDEISRAERAVDAARRAFANSSVKRRNMQARGFGKMTLHQVCGYAPRRLAPSLNQRLYELTTLSIGLKITVKNNKALIVSGLDRLIQITSTLQRAASETPNTYKRRGFIPPPSNSVLVSSRA